jgi:hypothetical protein
MAFWDVINQHAIAICVCLSLVALVFIVFGHVYREEVQLALKQPFVELPATTFDWWSVSHAVLFGLFGFLIPNWHFAFFTIGCMFEVVEDMLSGDESTQLADCMTNKESKLMCSLSINDDYWYAKWDDVFVNLLGYTVGSSIRTTFY